MPNVNDDRVRSRRLRRHEIQGAQFDAERGGHALDRSIASMDVQLDTAIWAGCHHNLAAKEWLSRGRHGSSSIHPGDTGRALPSYSHSTPLRHDVNRRA